MKIEAALADVRFLFLDTAPVIYHVEGVRDFQPLTDAVFSSLSQNLFRAATSSITLAECLVHPLRNKDTPLVERFRNVITHGRNTHYLGVDSAVETAASLRAQYRISLTDALQLAAAMDAGCDAFLTNDIDLKRVAGIRVLVLKEFES